GVARQQYLAVEDPRRLVETTHALQFDLPPCRARPRGRLPEDLRGAPAEGDEVDAQEVEVVEAGVGGQSGVEDEFLGVMAGPLLPEAHEVQDSVVLLIL